MRSNAGADAVLFTQRGEAISGLKDKPNELLCVRVQMRRQPPRHAFPFLFRIQKEGRGGGGGLGD